MPLLMTKLYAPPARSSLVLRPRLIAQLTDSLTRPLTLISAPAGFGKTTLLSEWRASPAGCNFPLAWLSLDEDDNDPARLLSYLVAALASLKPQLNDDALAALQAPQPTPSKAVLATLINRLNDFSEPFALLLDDYHVITADLVHDALAFLLDHLPSQMRLIILTRADPPLPLARLRARSQLAEIRAADLRFTLDEVAVFLNQVAQLGLPADAIATLETRAEGWIAGLQLAALSMQALNEQSRAEFVTAFGGSHHYILDYLVDEVLNVQPEAVRLFLLQTSILSRLCGPLCEAVVGSGVSQPGDGQAMLEVLERRNLFLIPLDSERRWYRYHHLFADVLNRRLEHLFPQQLPVLHRLASQWYEQNGFVPEATQQAVLAGDDEHAAHLVEQNGCQLMMQGEVTTLLKWIEAITPHSQTRPWLAILYAWALALSGQLDKATQILQLAERVMPEGKPNLELKIMLGSMAAVRAHLANMHGDTRGAIDYARQALQLLPGRVPFARSLRSVTTSLLGDASWMEGDLEEASRAYVEAARIGQAANNSHLVVIANSHQAEILMERGKLHQAAKAYSETLQLVTGSNGQATPLAERIYAGLSRIAYEQNDLEVAAHQAHCCLELCRKWGSFEFEAVSHVTLAQVAQAQGNLQDARSAMHAAEQLVYTYDLSPGRSIWVKAALSRLWLVRGNLERASQFVGTATDDGIPYLHEPEYALLLRLFLARGSYESALTLSGRWLEKVEASQRDGRIIEILILRALAFQGMKEISQALTSLTKALLLAQPEGYVRVFLDEGQPMAKLLHLARSRQLNGYAAELLAALDGTNRSARLPAQFLIEPLSARELEILKLIQAGYSNQVIADSLVISVATVKRHISNVYAKLGANSRTQAVALGRELRLFE